MSSQTRAKFGYLNYETMISNLSQKANLKKKLDAYDINFTPDTKECYVIAPDLTPWAIRSKVYTFDGIGSAIEQLRRNTDTYSGQIIAIQSNEKYRGYIVNATSDGDSWNVSPLSEHEEEIDYNTLGNQPILNLIGELDSPINVEDLENGIYKIKGQYTISSQLETVFLSAADTIITIKHAEDKTYIKQITSDEIVDYVIDSNGITFSTIVTSDFLSKQGYITEQEVDDKIAALNIITENDVKAYVQQTINESIGNVIDEKIDQALNEKLQSVDESEISNLF